MKLGWCPCIFLSLGMLAIPEVFNCYDIWRGGAGAGFLSVVEFYNMILVHSNL